MEYFIISILTFLGAILLVAEVALIPGFGVIGILGSASMIASVVYSFYAIGALAGFLTLLIVVAICIVLIMWAIYGKTLDRMSLKKNIDSTVQNPQTATLKVGDRGVSVTRLALIGEVDFDGNIVEVTSSSGLLDENTSVVISRISGGVIYVKKAS